MSEQVEKDEVVEEYNCFSLQDLMAHSRLVDANVAEEDHAAAKAEAMDTFGLVEKKGGKAKAEVPPAPPAPSSENPFA